MRELGPAGLRLVAAVGAAVADQDTVLVACSGGPDSLALAVAAAHVARRRPVTVTAACVDHGLQPGSAALAAGVVDRLGHLGCPARVLTVEVDPAGAQGPEAAARSARYAALDAEADRVGADAVLLGHTRDDQAETVLLALARGSGTRSLAGMAPVVGRYRRPLLGLDRADTVRACAEWRLDPWSDPHNAEARFRRVGVRQTVLPVLEDALGPGVAEALARTASLARADADLLDELAAAADPGTDTLDCVTLADLPAALRSRVIRRWLHRRGARDLAQHHVTAVDALVSGWRGQRGTDVPGLRVARAAGALTASVPTFLE